MPIARRKGFQPSADRRAQHVRGAELSVALAMARAWSETIGERQRQQAAWAFIRTAIDAFASSEAERLGRALKITPPAIAITFALDRDARDLARTVGQRAAELPIEQACFQLSTSYTALMPPEIRSARGMYYTPPVLTERLLDLAEDAGIDWQTARVLDPACGGGAFLLPVALRMKRSLATPNVVDDIFRRLRGFEIDPFAAWLTQAWLQIALADTLGGVPLPTFVEVKDALAEQATDASFDLVIGNPPYGRVTLPPDQRTRFKRSLFGHANLYGLFTDAALRWIKTGGVVAYVSPTSFLAGEYFKSLRRVLAAEAPPLAIDFITARRGIFEEVLQEALLATYRKGAISPTTSVHYLTVTPERAARVAHAGHFTIPRTADAPWLVPRRPEDQRLIDRLAKMPSRLENWGYQVSTGPLVWNRFKQQLCSDPDDHSLPLIWAEAIAGPNRFVHRADKRNHKPYFRMTQKDDWLKVSVECVLVQRTTAKEQPRRLVGAELPARFIKKHGAVIVENHLNMIRPAGKTKPKVSTAAVAAFINSSIADEAFRCISGSVAVSAFELEALPIPSVSQMQGVEGLIERNASREALDAFIRNLYLDET